MPSPIVTTVCRPDTKRVAYVREHNIYVESLESSAITPLTKDGSTKIVNGTFDWVYEEELSMASTSRMPNSVSTAVESGNAIPPPPPAKKSLMTIRYVIAVSSARPFGNVTAITRFPGGRIVSIETTAPLMKSGVPLTLQSFSK